MGEANSLGTIDGTTIYHYTPSLSLAAAFCASFGVSATLHGYQVALTKSWYMVPLLVGGVFETVGYAGRILGAQEAPNYTLGPYIVQALLILVAPTLIAASVYMIMGHIIHATSGDQYSIIRERILTKLFVLGDFTSFMVQSTGTSILTTKKEQKQKDVGNYIIIGGLFIQLLSFGLFMVTMIMFRARLAAEESKTPTFIPTGVKWKLQISALLFCSSLIMIRSIFRIVEYAQGQNGYLLAHESFSYIFDATLMFLAIAILNIVHPSKISALNQNSGGKAISWIINGKFIDAKAAGAAQRQPEKDEETAYTPVDRDTQALYTAQQIVS